MGKKIVRNGVLKLNRETLRRLTSTHLEMIRGARQGGVDTSICDTWEHTCLDTVGGGLCVPTFHETTLVQCDTLKMCDVTGI